MPVVGCVDLVCVINARPLALRVVCCLQCYLDAKAEQYDDPLCDRMVVSIQGGIYGALAYTDTWGPSRWALPEETCAGDEPDFGYGSKKAANNGASKNGAAKDGAVKVGASQDVPVKDNPTQDGGATKKPCKVFRDVDLSGSEKKDGESQPHENFLNLVLSMAKDNLVRDGSSSEQPDKPEHEAPALEGPAEATIANNQATSKKLYKGVAVIISGPFYVTSTHNGMIEETGLFEFTLGTWGKRRVASPANRWPIVRPGAAKLRFARQHEGDYAPKAGSA